MLHMAARIRSDQGNYAEAAEFLLRAIDAEFDPPPSIYFELAVMYAAMGQPARALAAFEALITRAPGLAYYALNDASLRPILPLMHELLSRHEDQARQHWRRQFHHFMQALNKLRPAYNRIRRARRRYSRKAAPGRIETGFAACESALAQVTALIESDDILLREKPVISLGSENPEDFASEAKEWNHLFRRKLRKQVLWAIPLLWIMTTFVNGRLDRRAAPPEPLPAGVVPATQRELGQYLASMLLAAAPDPKDRAAADIHAAHRGIYNALIGNQFARGNAPGLELGFIAEIIRLSRTDPVRYEYLGRYTGQVLGNLGYKPGRLYRKARANKDPIDATTRKVVETVYVASDMSDVELPPATRAELQRVNRELKELIAKMQ